MHETIQKAFSTAANTMRLMGHEPEKVVDAAFEFLAGFCMQYGIIDPAKRLEKAVERVKRRRPGSKTPR